MSRRRAHYVLSTHWDREWYQPYQYFRHRLVRLLDGVLAGLASGELQGPFTCDGQAIVLEDYVEVRPERAEEVRELVASGQLRVGPWYVLPDEFLVSGEALVRNLRLGREMARRWGGTPSSAGFVCDIFGHNSQMPQILAGFGMPMAFIWRGVNENGKRLARWVGADGTEVLAYRFESRGYSSYSGAVRGSFEHGDAPEPEEIDERLDAYVNELLQQTETDSVLLFDGGDHQEWDRTAYRVLATRLRARPSDVEYVHTALDEFAAEVLTQRERVSTVHHGELREPGRWPSDRDSQWLIPGVLSSRMPLKQANAACQALLSHWAEPLATLATQALGESYPQGFLDVAWRWLLQNQPHDSICGCSIDQVHDDMRYRFSQCEQIATRLRDEAARTLAANVAAPLPADALRVVLFNPLPRPVERVVDLTLQTPAGWATFNEFFGFEPKPAFRVHDAAGDELPYQRLCQAMDQPKTRIIDVRFPESYRTHDVSVALPVSLPAMGYATFTVAPEAEGAPTRHPETPNLVTSERSLENEHLAVTVAVNGSLSLLDKRTGARYERLLTFEDAADIGDGWYHGQAVNEQLYSSAAAQADVAVVANGPLLGTLRVRTTLCLPAEFDLGAMRRSDRWETLVLDSRITLRRGAQHVEVETQVHNTVCDHRLRVLLPTGAQAETFWTDTPFDAVERPIALRGDNHLYRELEVEGKPQQSWSAVWDGERGLAVIAQGLPEVAVKDQVDRPIALTLYRSTRRTVGTAGERGGQLLQAMAFRYWVAPLASAPDPTTLGELGMAIHAGWYDVQLTARDMPFYRRPSQVAPVCGALTLQGAVVLTSLRQIGAAVEVRLCNLNDQREAARLELGPALRHLDRAMLVDLESRALGAPWPLVDGVCELAIAPKQVVTISLSGRLET
ncbi:MAG: glycoside hydrolase family 38 C-terminal domain-containing protein [Anaerolineae bacterium]|jgi:alpha-mannosidase